MQSQSRFATETKNRLSHIVAQCNNKFTLLW
jgi:hypothetical protein